MTHFCLPSKNAQRFKIENALSEQQAKEHQNIL